jgi:hypothetical protein
VLQIADAWRGILKIVPGTNVLKQYVMSTWFNTKFGASGSAEGAGLPAYPFAALHPALLVHPTQLATWLGPDPLIPLPVLEFVFTWVQTWIEFEEFVGFQTAPVRS